MSAARTCSELLASHNTAGRHLVVGLDPDPSRIPACIDSGAAPGERVLLFNREIVKATADLVCAYKPNAAFYEALGAEGFTALRETISAIRDSAPDVPVILDAKRADIGSTNTGYVEASFGQFEADAITVHPYLGREALQPFLELDEKLIFVLCRTSNPGAGEFQDLITGDIPIYRHVARSVAKEWNGSKNCGLVVGATYPEELRQVRVDVGPALPILVPGVGAQGGDLQAVVSIHREQRSNAFLINASRSVLYAASSEDFATAARVEAASISEQVGAALAA